MIAFICQAMSLDQDDEKIYADFNADAYNELIETQFEQYCDIDVRIGVGGVNTEEGAKGVIS